MAKTNKQEIDLDVRVVDIEDFLVKDFKSLPPNETYKLTIDYPLSTPAIISIKTGKKGMDFISLLGKISKAYNDVYENEKKYGIWGHYIGDLVLEGITIDMKNRTIELHVGS